MARAATKTDLAELIDLALSVSDRLGLWAVSLRLDQALVEITGEGRPLAAATAEEESGPMIEVAES